VKGLSKVEVKPKVQVLPAKNLSDPRESILWWIADLQNKVTAIQNFVEQQNKDIIRHIQHDSLSKMEMTIIFFMLAQNKFSFNIKKLFYYDPQHFSAYVQTRDNEFYRIEVKIDDYMNFDQKKYNSEKEFYCALSDELIAYADRMPEEMKKNLLKEAEEMKKICK